MLYIRRIFHQDVTHQMTADRDGSKLFFRYDYTKRPEDRDVVFEFVNYSDFDKYNGEKIKGILHPDDSESRINGEFKGFVFSKLNAVEKDFLLIWNCDRDDSKYKFTLINSNHSMYQSLELLAGNKNHVLCCLSENDGESICEHENQTLNTNHISSKYRPYITAIKSKPFLLLAGISGTGKSRIVRELARACWDVDSSEYEEHKPKNIEMIQVKPNWHDSSELIGYVSRIDGVRYVVGPFLTFMVKAIHDPENPYFLCLDEMNLAPVEQYFAEYLSVIESRKQQKDGTICTDPIIEYSDSEEYHSLVSQLFPDDDERELYLKKEGGKRLTIPQNLIVVGTVNMDETTFSFSRKVLDRAMTIEMNEVDLKGGLKVKHEQIGKLGKDELIGGAVEGADVYEEYGEVCDVAIKYLEAVNSQLENTPFKIAYRTRNEALLYVVNNLPYNKDEVGNELKQEFVVARALDEITNMKILSRIEGDETKVTKKLLENLEETIKNQLETISPDTTYANKLSEGVCLSISLAKIDEMKVRLESGYTSFWS